MQPCKVLNWSLNFVITDLCDRKCPMCCCKTPQGGQHYPVETLREYAKHFQDFHTVNIIGGEPTLHPDFLTISKAARGWFGCKQLRVCTNGWGAKTQQEALRYYDVVAATRYDEETYAGCPSNKEDMRVLRQFCRQPQTPRLFVPESKHVDYTQPGGGYPCFNMVNTLGVQYGRVHVCCVAAGFANSNSVPIEGWRERITKIKPPCKGCVRSLSLGQFERLWRPDSRAWRRMRAAAAACNFSLECQPLTSLE